MSSCGGDKRLTPIVFGRVQEENMLCGMDRMNRTVDKYAWSQVLKTICKKHC